MDEILMVKVYLSGVRNIPVTFKCKWPKEDLLALYEASTHLTISPSTVVRSN